MSQSPLPIHLATRTWCPLRIFEERISKIFVSIKHINKSIILYTFHHTQVYQFDVVVQVVLHWWNNQPLPNIPFVHPFRNHHFLHAKQVQARWPLWQNILPSVLEELVPWERKFLQKWWTVWEKFVSSRVHWYSSQTFFMLCWLAISDLDISNSKDLIFLSFLSIIFNKSCQESLISSSALL